MAMRRFVPWSMITFRVLLGPVVLLGERCRWNGITLAMMVLAALVSDIFDGVLARRWSTDTAAMRLADSLADTAFYVCVAGALAFGMPAVWRAFRGGVLLLLACEALRFAFDFVKFGKPASYHSYLAKGWGLLLATAMVITFATQRASLWITAAIAWGVLSNLETLIMSCVLPVWQRDVKTLFAALRIRAQWMQRRTAAGTAAGAGLIFVALFFGATGVQGQSLRDVTYVGGTALQSYRVHGRLSIAATDSLVFLGPSKLSIPYDHVLSYESKSLKRVRVGLLTEGLWRLVAPWPEAKQLSLSYRDSEEHPQVIVLEMSRGDEALLVEVLKTRVSQARAPQTIPLVRPPVAGRETRAEH